MASPHETLVRYADAWNARDPRACAECFAEGGVREWQVVLSPLRATPSFEGRDAIAQGIGDFMAAVPDIRVEVVSLAGSEDGAFWLEWVVTGTHQGDWGPWEARGERVQFPGVSRYTMADGLIGRERMYWDTAMMTQGGS
jgi:steroid delta-isomerase-like uncharacterized protein